MRRFLIALGVLALLGLPRAVSAHDMCFPSDKTPYCLPDPFSDYWELNGGLPVFGYPVTAKADELNKDTGKMHPTQWLERNRLEYHNENKGTAYEVLLGLLGKERLAQLGRNPASEPREAGAKAGCLWFEQTGHNICNIEGTVGFKTYWETHGLKINGMDKFSQSLQLFGLPLTEPKMETNSAGDRVLTQWFERARFEWHPKNGAEYKVLLGLLGKEVHDNAGSPPPATLAIVSHRTYVDSIDFRWIVGEVVNNTASNQQFVKVIANLYDAGSNLVGTETGYTILDIVKAGTKSPFSILILEPPANFDHYTLQIEARETTTAPLDTFAILSFGNRDSEIGNYRYVYGEVRNDTGVPVKFTKIAITCYTKESTVQQVGFGYTSLQNIAVGQSSAFEILLSQWSGVERCEAQVQARKQ
ncbi:MAG TPA: hypothetical protein DEF47_04985 [Herpetosiphon sp.]|uniref:Uncharacterized protein n=1 Tax=Herpetosiphon aurantiacus (strain ATCC 23779 / DSM 785 / 114-95) TaxID=316274 RepID=A9B2J4_HERA2|nr:FxLYD domain-containing protein [Herpetosiphon sp.]ABX04039.1 hypothetical protein Haur_1394 [Herpetosiphon aurantiacus DSM 785]HBW49237.1 hypothetical protein [Herpetosiphon sp.]